MYYYLSSMNIEEMVMAKKTKGKELPFTIFQFINYLSKGRTLRETSRKFKISEKETLRLLKQKHPNYDLFEPLNEYNEVLYCLVKQPAKEIILKPRIIKTRFAEGPEDYIQVQLRDKTDELRIVPLCDAHYGNKCHRADKFRRYLDYIEKTDGVYAVLMGDMTESKTETGKGHIYDQTIGTQDQMNNMTTMLSPIAHKILAMCPGNHEDQIFQRSGIDIVHTMASRLEIPYFRGAGAFHILWKGKKFGFKIFHGKGGSQTKGGKMTAAGKSKRWWEGMDFYLSGHTHDSICNPETKFVPDIANCRLVEKTYWVLVAPSFLSYWGGYAQKTDYEPPTRRGVACVLYPNGKFKAEYTAGY